MNKEKFINLIDNNFPYNNLDDSINLVNKAIKIWPECVYYILHELIRIPESKKKKVHYKYIEEIINYIDKKFSHKFKSDFLLITRILVKWKKISDVDILNYIEKFEDCKDMLIPINILYFSSEDEFWYIEAKFNKINSMSL